MADNNLLQFNRSYNVSDNSSLGHATNKFAGGGGGNMNNLENRVSSLEATTSRIEAKLDANLDWLKKADSERHSEFMNIRSEISSTKKWMLANTITILVGFIAILIAIIIGVVPLIISFR